MKETERMRDERKEKEKKRNNNLKKHLLSVFF